MGRNSGGDGSRISGPVMGLARWLRYRYLGLLMLCCACFLLTAEDPSSAGAQEPPRESPRDASSQRPSVKPPTKQEFAPDRIIVKFEDPVDSADRRDVRREEGLKKGKDLALIGAEVAVVEGRPVEEAARDLDKRPDVEYAVPDRLVHHLGYAEEPRFGEMWGLDNTGQAVNGGGAGTPDVDVNAKEASAVTQGDPNLVVAVLDDGVDLSHPDLAERKWINPGEMGPDDFDNFKQGNGLDDDGNGYVDDVEGWDFANKDKTVYDRGDGAHGTHTASTIAASVNGEGIAGVAPGIQLMPLKFIGPSGGTVSDAIAAIVYAKAKGAKIVNASWGYRGSPDPALADAIRASGMLFVAAAGNGGTDAVGDDNDADPNNAEYPASYDLPNVVSVAAVNGRGELPAFSNYGAATVDLVAPGVDVLGALPATPGRSGAALSTVGPTGKALVSGFGPEEIEIAANRASFLKKALGAVGRGTEPVVLVDDDRSSAGLPDVGPVVSEAIRSATGVAPEIISVANGDGPSLASLEGKAVVWATDQAYSSGPGKTTLTAPDQQTLNDFLGGGGKLVLSGMDALYGIENDTFVNYALAINAKSDVGSTAFEGSTGTVFAGESYRFGGPLATPGYHDEVSPNDRSFAPTQQQGVYPGAAASWTFRSGTSTAAPHAAGSAALLGSVRPELLADPAALRKVLLDTAKPAPATAGKTATGRMVDALAAVRSDGTAPTVTGTTPTNGAIDVPVGNDVEALFSEELDPATVGASAFTLVRQGTTTPVPAAVGYDSAAQKAVLNPDAHLAYGSTYTATVKGGAAGVKDRAGNPLAADKTWSFSTPPPPPAPDTTPPDTFIEAGPSGTVGDASASFGFASSEPGSTFRCSLDSSPFEPCSSPKAYDASLGDGPHAFRVAAVDAAGNVDPSPAERTWTVDKTAPTVASVTPSDGATGVLASAKVEAVFSENMDPASLTTSTFTLVKQGTTTPVSAAVTYDATAKKAVLTPSAYLSTDATYTATVKGGAAGVKDRAGNPLAADKTWSFSTTDTKAPDTKIDSGPDGTVASATASFAFSSTEAGSTFLCSLDRSVFSSCSSPKSYASLPDGLHTFEVKAVDAAGNVDSTAASRTWKVDAAAPTVTALGEVFVAQSTLGATVGSSDVPVQISWSGSDGTGSGITKYELQQSTNGGAWSADLLNQTPVNPEVQWPPSSSVRTLSTGTTTYRFRARALDVAGNWGAWTYGRTFSVAQRQEGGTGVTYTGTWTPLSVTSAYGGAVRYASVAGATTKFTFTGQDVAWVSNRSTNRGRAEVYVDGVKEATVDLYSSTTQVRRVVFQKQWATSGSHTIQIKVLGTKNASSTGTRVDTDAFLFSP